MRFRSAQQVFVSYVVLIGVVVAALSFGAHSTLRRLMIDVAIADMRRELALGRVLYEASLDASPDSVADLLGTLSGRRVTVVAPDGSVIGDSRVPTAELPQVANHGDRAEIAGALAGSLGTDQRVSQTIGTGHLYLAEQSARGDVIRFAFPTAELDAAIGHVQQTILSVGGLALLLAIGFSVVFSLFVTRPLRAIAWTARQMSGGELSQRIRVFRGDELGDLADALNSLAEELQRRLSQLEDERAEMQALIDSMTEAVLAFDSNGAVRRANPAARRIFALPEDTRGLAAEAVGRRPDFLRLVHQALSGRQVTPTELAYHERSLLASAHPLPAGGAVAVFLDVSELRRLEGVRRDFVANASHELKTPLTAIRGYSETLLDNDLPPELRHQFAETVKDNADRLQRIVDDLLDLSRIESGGWRVAPARVRLGDVVREVWHGLRVPETSKQIDLSLEIEPDSATVIADPGGIRQVLTNLIGNAVRYTPDGGRITVAARRIGATPGGGTDAAARAAAGAGLFRPDASDFDRVVIEVRDTGTGIPSQHLPRIFERFYRVDPARSRIEGGTGLGLAIVKHLVEAHGGHVEAESELGTGTTIRLVFPDDMRSRAVAAT